MLNDPMTNLLHVGYIYIYQIYYQYGVSAKERLFNNIT